MLALVTISFQACIVVDLILPASLDAGFFSIVMCDRPLERPGFSRRNPESRGGQRLVSGLNFDGRRLERRRPQNHYGDGQYYGVPLHCGNVTCTQSMMPDGGTAAGSDVPGSIRYVRR
jgi:hypothetical protein